jgi:GTP-binding protein
MPASAAPSAPSPYDVTTAEFVASAADDASMIPPTIAEIAFGGRSNVGKSSMMNVLMQRKGLVRTSNTPGCTRAVNFFRVVTRGGLDLHLVDLPGYGFARRSKEERRHWGTLLEGFVLGRQTLRAVVVVVDARRGLEDDDRALLEFCAEPRPGNAPLRTLVVATKLDALPKAKRKPLLASVKAAAGRPVIGFSSIEVQGRDEAWRAIERAVLGTDREP